MRSLVQHGSILLLAFGLSGCGSSNNPAAPSNATPAPTPAPCTQTTLTQTSGTVPAQSGVGVTFTVPTTGRLDVFVDWTFTDSVMRTVVTDCARDPWNAGTCTNMFLNLSSPPKPTKKSVPDFAPGTYTLIIGNWANSKDEAVSASVVLSSSTCAAATSLSLGVMGTDVHTKLTPFAAFNAHP